MSKKTILASLFCLLPLACSTSKTTQVEIEQPIIKNLNEVDTQFQTLQKSLVRIHLKDDKQNSSIGTGFFFKTKDMLVTNYHVLEGQPDCLSQNECSVSLGLVKNANSVSEFQTKISVIVKFKDKDLVFLKVHETQQLAGVVPLKNRTQNNQGSLTAIGFYQNEEALTFSQGKKMSTTQSLEKQLTSIIVSGGFSGSPVVNKKGELVGVVSSFKPIHGQNIGLAEYVVADDLDSL